MYKTVFWRSDPYTDTLQASSRKRPGLGSFVFVPIGYGSALDMNT